VWISPARLQVHNHVRGLAPAPGAWFELKSADRAERVKLLATEVDQCGFRFISRRHRAG
jgi:methionyl-tRNA formyltransferase